MIHSHPLLQGIIPGFLYIFFLLNEPICLINVDTASRLLDKWALVAPSP
jgi:hypothetical protein